MEKQSYEDRLKEIDENIIMFNDHIREELELKSVQELVEKQKPLESEIRDIVDKNFWEILD